MVVSLFIVAETSAQQSAPAAGAPPAEPFQILDNSFFVEEAFNQEAGIFQNIFGFVRSNDTWSASFVQEWPVLSQAHQLSYTVTGLGGGGSSAWGDSLLNYRFQAMTRGLDAPRFRPASVRFCRPPAAAPDMTPSGCSSISRSASSQETSISIGTRD